MNENTMIRNEIETERTRLNGVAAGLKAEQARLAEKIALLDSILMRASKAGTSEVKQKRVISKEVRNTEKKHAGGRKPDGHSLYNEVKNSLGQLGMQFTMESLIKHVETKTGKKAEVATVRQYLYQLKDEVKRVAKDVYELTPREPKAAPAPEAVPTEEEHGPVTKPHESTFQPGLSAADEELLAAGRA